MSNVREQDASCAIKLISWQRAKTLTRKEKYKNYQIIDLETKEALVGFQRKIRAIEILNSLNVENFNITKATKRRFIVQLGPDHWHFNKPRKK